MTLQEVFDTAAMHMLQQGEAAKNTSGNCFYRSPNGCRCPVGWLIPDNLYRPDLEGNIVRSLSIESVLTSAGVLPIRMQGDYERYMDLLVELQQIHDNREPRQWKSYLISLAQRFNLEEIVAKETPLGRKNNS
jgi:hypothetical protein